MAAINRSSIAVLLAGALAACGDEPPPPSAADFIENPVLLEAAMVRCGQDRAASRYDPECVNARDAVDSIAKATEAARRQELEAESERKRQTLRRAQEAAANARRRAEEARQKREEAEYYGEFEPLPPPDDRDGQEAGTGGPPTASPPGASGIAADETQAQPAPAPPASNEVPDPGAPTEEGTATDLDAVREELRRRQN